ncbi:hypothetical protein ABPG75_009333 [Micractinium tetrahymenae]
MGRLEGGLFMAVFSTDLELLKACLEGRADPNARGSRGATPLLRAAAKGSAACVAALLAAGADPNAAADNGATPLVAAAQAGYTDCCAAVLAAGAVSRAWGANCFTPAHHAVARCDLRVPRQLLGASPEAALAQSTDGCTPLGMALAGVYTDGGLYTQLAQCVLEEGAQPPAGELLPLLQKKGPAAASLYASVVACQPLSAAEWALVPTPGAGLGAALPAVLQRSAAEAALLVQRLPAADRESLQVAALCLGRAQRQLDAPLPTPLVWRVLSLAATQGRPAYNGDWTDCQAPVAVARQPRCIELEALQLECHHKQAAAVTMLLSWRQRRGHPLPPAPQPCAVVDYSQIANWKLLWSRTLSLPALARRLPRCSRRLQAS